MTVQSNNTTVAAFGWAWGGTRKLGAAFVALAMTAGLYATMPARSQGAPAGVIVRAVAGLTHAAEEAVLRAGGSIQRVIGIINGFSAVVPTDAIDRLRLTNGIASVTPNAAVRLAGYQDSLGYDPDKDYGSMQHVNKIINSVDAWNAHYTGAGVDVALIDSGVAPVNGLTQPGKVVNGPDLSFESQDPNLRYLDSFGHGTHMAGIIAGKDDGTTNLTDSSKFTGVAPGARIVSVKVAAGDGSTDVSQVLAGIDWVVQHKNDNGLNIRVLNLSFGTDSAQDYSIDPLAFAAEVAWRRGIVVVASGGNGGNVGTLSDPALDPFIIAVGAETPNGTDDPKDDTVLDFSQRGSATRHVDIVAPGKSILSLRVPGSFIDSVFPSGRVGTRFFRGSGTSQAAAVVSGTVALLLQQRPALTPDQVKTILMTSTRTISTKDPIAAGTGLVNAKNDRAAAVPSVGASTQLFPASSGNGSLEASRGTIHAADPDGNELTGEQDIFGRRFDSSSWSTLAANGSSWSGGTWNGSTWSGSSWSGSSWSGSSWSGSSWSGSSWSGSSWSGSSWSGSSWSGGSWEGSSWSGRSWEGSSWSGSSWSGRSWSGALWSSSYWGV